MEARASQLAGTQWLPRDVAKLLWDHDWVNAENLMVMVATVGAESLYYAGAWHYNAPSEGGDGSTDWGMFQLNDGNKGGQPPDNNGMPQPGGTKTSTQIIAFRDEAWDAYKAVRIARALYVDRSFSPWAAYNNGAYKTFIPKACVAVCNMLAVLNGLQPII